MNDAETPIPARCGRRGATNDPEPVSLPQPDVSSRVSSGDPVEVLAGLIDCALPEDATGIETADIEAAADAILAAGWRPPLPESGGPSPWDAYVAAFREFQERDPHGATVHPTAHHMHALEAALEVFEPCDRALRSELLKAIDDPRGLGEAVALAIGDTYAGETFSDPTFERGTEAALRVFRELVEEVPSASSPQPAPDGWYPAAMREHDRANAAELDRSAAERRAASWWEAAKYNRRVAARRLKLYRDAEHRAMVAEEKLRAERDALKARLDEMIGFAGQQSQARREVDLRVGRVEALCREWEANPAMDWTAGDAAEHVRVALQGGQPAEAYRDRVIREFGEYDGPIQAPALDTKGRFTGFAEPDVTPPDPSGRITDGEIVWTAGSNAASGGNLPIILPPHGEQP